VAYELGIRVMSETKWVVTWHKELRWTQEEGSFFCEVVILFDANWVYGGPHDVIWNQGFVGWEFA
jgi:hypothetical protein